VKWHNYFLSIFIFTLCIRLVIHDYDEYTVTTQMGCSNAWQ